MMLNQEKLFETQRLYLHEFRTTDAQFLFELNADSEVIRYTGDPPFTSVEAAERFIERYDQYTLNGMGRWTVRLKSTDSFIGWCGLKRHPNDEVDIGFRFLRRYWGHGYATEAAQGCLAYGFYKLGLSTIIARVMHENAASIRVIEKLGMTYQEEIICEAHPAKKYVLSKTIHPNV